MHNVQPMHTSSSIKATDLGLGSPCSALSGLYSNPVSYTHLDVYKRQPLESDFIANGFSAAPISTLDELTFIKAVLEEADCWLHLDIKDVYKRQL